MTNMIVPIALSNSSGEKKSACHQLNHTRLSRFEVMGMVYVVYHIR